MPGDGEHLTAKNYVDYVIFDSVDASSLLRLDPEEKLQKGEKDSIFLNSTLTSLKTRIEDMSYHQCLMIKILILMTLN